MAALDISVFGLFFVLNSILSGRRDFLGMTIGYVVYCSAKVVGAGYILVIGTTITNALLLNVAASILAVALLAWRVELPSFRFRLTFWRPILHLALPIAIRVTGTKLLGVIDLWSLNAIGVNIADEVKGYYVAAITLARMPTICAFVFSSVLVPTVSGAIGMGATALALAAMRGAFRVLLLVLLPGCALIAVEAAPVMGVLFSEPYAAGAELCRP